MGSGFRVRAQSLDFRALEVLQVEPQLSPTGSRCAKETAVGLNSVKKTFLRVCSCSSRTPGSGDMPTKMMMVMTMRMIMYEEAEEKEEDEEDVEVTEMLSTTMLVVTARHRGHYQHPHHRSW